MFSWLFLIFFRRRNVQAVFWVLSLKVQVEKFLNLSLLTLCGKSWSHFGPLSSVFGDASCLFRAMTVDINGLSSSQQFIFWVKTSLATRGGKVRLIWAGIRSRLGVIDEDWLDWWIARVSRVCLKRISWIFEFPCHYTGSWNCSTSLGAFWINLCTTAH